MLKKHRLSQRTMCEKQAQLAELRDLCRSVEDELRDARRRIASQEKAEAELKSWKRQEPEIKHYLRSIAGMAK